MYPVVIGFYNLENLYDTINDPTKNDEDFTPEGLYGYNSRIYWDKLGRLSTVLSQIGTEISPDGAAIIGVAEIENDTVLTDLVKQKELKDRNLKFVHYNSPDVRGVDVGLLYNPKYFSVINSEALYVQLPGGAKDAFFTRDVLYVKGVLMGDTVHVFVNHWPSRRGGEERSAPARAAAAMVGKQKIDSLMAINPETKVVLMGDLNDDPISPSVTKVLNAKGKTADVKPGGLFNPWVDYYKNGIGTLAYQDSWGLFDQIIISHGWLNREQTGIFYYKANIFNREFMVQKTGRYRGYARRTWDGSTYNYGYSDHFPTYLTMLKRKN
ncbi:MAG: endonuclease/exonuclease/phosphatase [Ferruginibacter sp.]